MIFYLIGVDYKKANIEQRETVHFFKKSFIRFLNSDGLHNARIFYTCNRFEVYDFAQSIDEASGNLNIFKKNFDYIFGGSYVFLGGKKVFGHLVRLASGLESQLKGERQILEQLINFSSQKDFPDNLKTIFTKAIFAAKLIREKATLDNKVYSIADLVLEDILGKNAVTGELKIAIVGTGKIAELFASKRLKDSRFCFLAHKNYLKARELAKKAGGQAANLSEIEKTLLDTDILISATTSPHYILGVELFRKVAEKRKKVLYAYDLAIPRDIEPEVSSIDGIVLKNMDDLRPLFEKYEQRIEKEISVLENLAEDELKKYDESFYEEKVESRHAYK